MQCDPQQLLTDAKCFAATNSFFLQVAQASLWCQIAEAIASGGTGQTEYTLQADDGLWYEITSLEFSPGDASVDFGQLPVAAGSTPYRVIVNLTDGLKYKFRLVNDGGSITGGYDGTGPTAEAETPTIIIDVSGRRYQLNFITDSGSITFQLDQV